MFQCSTICPEICLVIGTARTQLLPSVCGLRCEYAANICKCKHTEKSYTNVHVGYGILRVTWLCTHKVRYEYAIYVKLDIFMPRVFYATHFHAAYSTNYHNRVSAL